MRRLQSLLLAALLPLLLGAQPGKKPGAAPEQVSVTVATRDLAVGEVVKEADLAAVQVDKQWATGSVVQTESRQYILGQRLLHPVLKGDLVTWMVFETTKNPALHDRCAQAVALPESALEQVQRARQLLLERKR
ncbi:SAF domain-containing protein [Pyxidicoccus trucidator]|uniref:SAF domain-containing protein n=1 Tax=Pyxidicoccus trucidator TaxID=2709662 RepID=UPI0013DA9703|nr:SAF domain-containing protein [Pyxidicoccus trucidator]